MSFHVTRRWAGDESNPTADRLREVLAELDAVDPDHPDVSLTHESEWGLSVFPSGLVIWENLEDGVPRHMRGVSRERALALWLKLAEGRIGEIDAEPWLPGYGTERESGE